YCSGSITAKPTLICQVIVMKYFFIPLIIFLSAHISSELQAGDNELVIFRYDSQLSGYIDKKIDNNPKFKWRKQLPCPVESMPILADNNILLSGTDKNIYCLSSKNGDIKWTAELNGITEAPVTLYNNSVLACTNANKIYRLDLDDGKIIWQYQTGGKMAGAVNVWTNGQEVRLLAGCYDNKVYCLDFASGSAIWQIEAENYINGSISILDNKAAFGSCDGFVYFIDIEKGIMSNKFDTGAYVPGWPVLQNNICYSGNYQGRITAVNTDNSDLIWEYKLADGSNIMDGPALDSQKLFITDKDGSLYCLDKNTGKEIWKFQNNNKEITPPSICSDRVILGSENGWIYMLDTATGKTVWKYLIGEEISEPAFISDSQILFTDNSGRIYCFEI
ncbi:MAG: PQQ-binding-like beta-propeller repeat protein, partial [Sedimentisphaerales bacterium]|nr:PQQ-binding-like beta-propeller repeat protein [Sedimentisphaerales bacterium]